MNAQTRIAPRGALPAGLLLFIVSLLAFVPSARAISGEEHLTTFGSFGAGAGQGRIMGKASAGPLDGHIFVNDGNERISEFTPWGVFVKAFGWDVAPAGVNEQQQVTVRASAGQFRLSFKGDTSADIPHDASAAEVQGALEALGSIGPAGVTVSQGPSDSSSTRYLVAFTGAALKEGDREALGAEPGTVPLSGGSPASGVAVATVADGHPPTAGLESCTAESGCREGSRGTGAGQIGPPGRIAVDAGGDIYLTEGNVGGGRYRVQKFDPAGRFLLMFGGEVDKTTHADVCTAADLTAGDTCGAGVPGTGPGQFSANNGISIGPGGRIVVADDKRVEEFEPDGTFLAEVSFGQPLGDLIAAPAGGGLFASYFSPHSFHDRYGIAKFSSTGASLCGFPVSTIEHNGANPNIAADPDGHLFAVREGFQEDIGEVAIIQLVEFSGACPASVLSELTLESSTDPQGELLLTHVNGLGANSIGDLFITRVNGKHSKAEIEIYGPPPVQFEPPPQVPPSITAQYAVGVDPADATVRAEINPHFWTDSRYYVEYGLGKCSEGGCTLRQPLAPGVLVSKTVKGSPVTTGDVVLEGLAPGSVYHYRFVAQGGGGGPVRGVGGQVGADGAEAGFRTPALPDSAPQGCANEALRSGPAAALPDCRAYEMVSPLDKDGGDIRDLLNLSGFPVALYQPAADGESIAYSSYRAFAGAPAGSYSLQYIAKRSSSGWATESISPPHGGKSPLGPGQQPEREYQGFTPDLCSGWLFDAYSPLAPGAVEGNGRLYRRDNCSPSASPYEALTTTASTPNYGVRSQVQGFSASGTTSVVRVPIQEEPKVVWMAYEIADGVATSVCILPDETELSSGCSAGSPSSSEFYADRGSSLSHAVSEDGSRVYWTAANLGPGKVYLRLEGTSTVPVSGTQTQLPSIFLGASADGSKALFMPEEGAKAKNLYLYSLAGEGSTRLAGEVIGVAGTSEDLSSVYFVAKEAIAAAGQNERGEEAQAGRPNLYLSQEGAVSFVATLDPEDVEVSGLGGPYSDIHPNALYHVASATSDGGHLAFMSVNQLTGYDNTDATNGERDSEAFQYDAGTGALRCLSCNPGGARPHGRGVQAPVKGVSQMAALLPAALSALYAPRAQSADGSKVFFTAYDALVPRDTNGVADVYEWERPGSGSCSESSPAYSPANGGCLYLLSSGTSASDSELIDSSPDGRDAFFLTNQSLLSQDPGLIDLYDARTGGGFPPPPPPAAACEGEACQGPYSPPNDPTPSSSTFSGAGNVTAAPHKKPHHKKKKHKKHSKRSSNNRQAKRTADRGAAR